MKRPLSRLALSASAPLLLSLAASACGPATPPPDERWQHPRDSMDPRDRRTSLPVDPESRTPPPGPARPPTEDHSIGPHGEHAAPSGYGVRVTLRSGAGYDIGPSELHPPAGDKGLLAIAPTSVFYLPDGTLLVGVDDGTVTAIDSGGHRRFSVGFRGAVSDIAAAGEGLVAITTKLGVLALLGGDGKVHWEHQITAEPLGAAVVSGGSTILTASQRGVFAYSMTGEQVFTHAASRLHIPCLDADLDCRDDKAPSIWVVGDGIDSDVGVHFALDSGHPPVPSLVPTFPLTFRRVLDGAIVSLLPSGSAEVAVLLARRTPRNEYDWDTDDKHEVVRVGGSRTTRADVPNRATTSEVFVEGTRATPAAIFVDAMVTGPNGNPWVIARKLNSEKTLTGDALLGRWGGAAAIFEVDGTQVKERRDLFKTFSTHWLSTPMVAADPGTASLFCFGEDDPTCAVYEGPSFRLLQPPAKPVSLTRIGEAAWMLTDDGKPFRIDTKTYASFDAIPSAPDTALRAVAGTSEKDVWADFHKRYALLHHDGSAWKEVPVSLVGDSIVVRAPDDAWTGRSRWDGKQWSIVHGAPAATAVLARGKDDVWLGDGLALWHGTAPGPLPVRLTSTSTEGAAAPAPAPLVLGAADTVFGAERVKIPVSGEASLDAAHNVAASKEGVVWMLGPDRIVEVGASGKGTTIRFTGRESFGKWALPEAKGKGIVLHRDEKRGRDRRDEVRRLDGSTTVTADVQMIRHDAVAVSSDPVGATWILGAPADFTHTLNPGSVLRAQHEAGLTLWEEFGPHALVRTDKDAYRPVLGLPSAAWCDVSAASDGGAWFAGALEVGPAGEGILVHAKGLLGEGGVTRYRAAATLFAVAATGPDEAWAVGAAGTILHVKGASVTRYSLPSGEWLRSVTSAGPEGGVWIGGDGGTLLHFDGATWSPVAHALGTHAAITGIAAARDQIWAVGPSGILLLKRRTGAPKGN